LSQQSKSLARNVIIPIYMLIFISSQIIKFMEDTKPKIIIGNKGPLVIKGGVTLIHPDGLEEQRDGTVALCRCGLSAKKPFCDGSHKGCDTW